MARRQEWKIRGFINLALFLPAGGRVGGVSVQASMTIVDFQCGFQTFW